MSIPDLFCPFCSVCLEPGAGFTCLEPGAVQVGFWCQNCGRQIPVSIEWSSVKFRDAVFSSLNPFSGGRFPSLSWRLSHAVSPQAVSQLGVSGTRVWVRSHLDDGVKCPTCDQHAQRYKRRLNSGIARWLIVLTSMSPRGSGKWVKTRDVIMSAASLKSFGTSLGSGEAASLLPFWKMIEPKPNDDPSKKCSGVWRPTEAGHAFVACETCVPKAVFVYNSECEGFSGELTNIREALGRKFNYEELMTQVA